MAKLALEPLKDEETATELSSRFELHPTLIHFWKCALLGICSAVIEAS